MENQQVSQHKLSDVVKEFLAMEPGPKKNLLYNSTFRNCSLYTDSFVMKDGNFYASGTTFKITRAANNKFYLKQSQKSGFTVESNGKMKIWFGKKVTDINSMLEYAIKFRKLDWYKPHHNVLLPILTATVLGKIFAGKVTNPTDMCKTIISSKRWKGVSPKTLLRYLNTMRDNSTSDYFFSAQELMVKLGPIIHYAQDPNHALERFINDFQTLKSVDIFDMIEQAIVLDRKINYRWSEKRLREVHKMWTDEIMVYEADKITDEPYLYADIVLNTQIVKDHPSIKPILNDRDLFIHAKMQHHCVYTNYQTKIVKGMYLAFEVRYNSDLYTMGIVVQKTDRFSSGIPRVLELEDPYEVDQVRGRYNADAPKDVQEICREFLKTFNKQVDAGKILSFTSSKPKMGLYAEDALPW